MIFSPPESEYTGHVLTSLNGLSARERHGLYLAKTDSPIFFRAMPRRLKWCKAEKRWIERKAQ